MPTQTDYSSSERIIKLFSHTKGNQSYLTGPFLRQLLADLFKQEKIESKNQGSDRQERQREKQENPGP